MKKFVLAAIAALVATAPAVAAPNDWFTGPHVDISAGYDDVKHRADHNSVNYAGSIGVDAPLGTDAVIGVEVTADNVFENSRQYGVDGRVGYALTPQLLAYGKVGYENWHDVNNKDFNGVRYGGGVQLAMTKNAYLKAEYRRTDYVHNISQDGVLGGIGIKF